MKEVQEGKIKMPEMNYSILKSILHWIYTGSTSLFTPENVMDIMHLSHLYQMQNLQKSCDSYIQSVVQGDPTTCLSLLSASKAYNSHHLYHYCLRIIINHYKELDEQDIALLPQQEREAIEGKLPVNWK